MSLGEFRVRDSRYRVRVTWRQGASGDRDEFGEWNETAPSVETEIWGVVVPVTGKTGRLMAGGVQETASIKAVFSGADAEVVMQGQGESGRESDAVLYDGRVWDVVLVRNFFPTDMVEVQCIKREGR